MYLLYYLFVFFTFIYCLYKYNDNTIFTIIILAFYSGLAAFPGKFIENPYKILLLTLTIYAALKFQPFIFNNNKDKLLFIVFLLFSVSFLFSSILNQNKIILVLSQYGKYLNPFIIFYIFKNFAQKTPHKFYKILFLLILLLTVQITLSFAKLFTIGIVETTVGSVAYIGGGPATIIPILGFILLWIHKKGQLQSKDWGYILLLTFIAFMSVKRSIWFIMPILLICFTFYIPKKKLPKKILWILLSLPLFFYLGVRLNSTLNKEQKMWGSFDIDYVINYTNSYNFGEYNKLGENKKLGQGRGGSTLLLLNKILNPSLLNWQDLFGYGLEEFVTKDYDNFDEIKYGINSKGAVTGFFNTYISFGFIGVFLFLIYAFSIINYIKNTRIKYVIIVLFIWEYFFYIGMLFNTQALNLLFFYIIIYLSIDKEIKNYPIISLNKKNS